MKTRLSAARRTLAWHNSGRTCKSARDRAVGAIYGVLRAQLQEDSRAVCMATTRTGNASPANGVAPASKEMHNRVSRLIYALQLKRGRLAAIGRCARVGRERGEMAPLCCRSATTAVENGARYRAEINGEAGELLKWRCRRRSTACWA